MPQRKQPSIPFPAIRSGLVAALFELASEDFQQLVWAKNRLDPHGRGYSGFEFVSDVFEDYDYSSTKAREEVFYTDEEQVLVKRVLEALEVLSDRHGDLFEHQISETGYIVSPEWKALMQAARPAYELLADNDKRYGNE